MNKNLYIEKLEWFKQNEKPEVVLLLEGNPEMVKIIIAWTSMDVKHANIIKGSPGKSESESWVWLWDNAIYSLQELKDKLGTSLSEAALEGKTKPLISNRIIYPDGTINSFIERYLRERVVKLFEVNSKRSSKKK